MYKIKDIAKILNVSDRTVERKFPRFLEKVFSAAQKPFLKMRIAKRLFTAFLSKL
jgi:transcriptional regulator GlxA family with amidase domain